jgi:succinyldiaminopimelate transaminase
MALSPLPEYPWDRMEPYRRRAAAHPGGIVDLSVGSPIDPAPASVRKALAEASDAHGYPATAGSLEVNEAIASWFARRRGVPGLTARNILPTVGSKEFVAWLPFMLGLGSDDFVVHPVAAYPTYAIGAAMAGASAIASDDPDEWPEGTRLIWLNSPGNPDGRVLDVGRMRAAVTAARALGSILASDECYAELGWEAGWDRTPIPSILDPRVVDGDFTDVLAAYSLSKQSNLAGYRAAFAAGDPDLIARLTTVRKHAGMMVPAPVQHAMAAALDDDGAVEVQRGRYHARRSVLKPALEKAGFRIDHSEAGLYLWASEDLDCWESIRRLAEAGILAGPGVFYGDLHTRHVRLSLTASDERIREAADRLAAWTR